MGLSHFHMFCEQMNSAFVSYFFSPLGYLCGEYCARYKFLFIEQRTDLFSVQENKNNVCPCQSLEHMCAVPMRYWGFLNSRSFTCKPTSLYNIYQPFFTMPYGNWDSRNQRKWCDWLLLLLWTVNGVNGSCFSPGLACFCRPPWDHGRLTC